jgi:hypothetical protein
MTEQEIEQARADVDKLDIAQLRCGVLLQLLHIESLKKERDEYRAKYNECYLVLNDVIKERDAWVERHKACVKCLGEALQDTADLAATAKLALDSAVDVYATCDRYGDGDQKAMESLSKAITALRQAGVQ